ncbi:MULTISPECIES: hypothetical protein [Xanthomonas]|uniref:Uncharacterized protein n=2 Tax=Xanthomonas TaxID=338 RepID=A0A7Z7J0X6_XANCH|nr:MULTISPECIES: hypothetical protein [Xanthomonas]ATS39242.1 hypothetical protein XcfCFBP6988P_14865 [Xanthomonas citri pv. phaseoli var. fuscans]ATS41952.1 hypothetical protein XcfCFBP6989P_05630 [Xanthomonas citri pv. phaseoli var. fuscans]ATS47245.1 hypothetical protein XcfCFBP6990P_11735 [Xanthomonas citri pv. phaseoli var. fuscans]ATS86377.1 hypothetical protein XcfCFBP6991P_22500 [Xanthomonas citri pv. phaseoli var. fuscans]QWN20887.1 hypothetical protein DGM98_12800 [Xanthomonas citri]
MPLIEPLKFRKSGSTVVAPAEMEPGDQIPGAYISDIAGSNLLINGDMRINQRAFAGGALTASAFGYDRWFADTGGANVSVSAAGVITHASGTICQAIEAPRGVFGASITISVGDLSGGNLNVSVGGVAGTITAGTGRRYVSIAAPGSSGTGNLIVKISPATASVTYREIAVVRGGDMAGFDYQPAAFLLIQCQRFYEKSYPLNVAAGTVTDAGQSAFFLYGVSSPNFAAGYTTDFKVSKRGTPAVTLYSPNSGAAGKMYSAGTNADVNGVAGSPGISGFFPNSGTIAATDNLNIRWHWVADAEITS